MWTAEEWAIRNAPIVRHHPWNQQAEQNITWDNNIKIVADEENPTFLSAAVTTRSQRRNANNEGTDFIQGLIPSLPLLIL
jgi:hypothetical protein